MITNEVAKFIDKFTSVGSLINPGGLMAGEIPSRVHRTQLSFTN